MYSVRVTTAKLPGNCPGFGRAIELRGRGHVAGANLADRQTVVRGLADAQEVACRLAIGGEHSHRFAHDRSTQEPGARGLGVAVLRHAVVVRGGEVAPIECTQRLSEVVRLEVEAVFRFGVGDPWRVRPRLGYTLSSPTSPSKQVSNAVPVCRQPTMSGPVAVNAATVVPEPASTPFR